VAAGAGAAGASCSHGRAQQHHQDEPLGLEEVDDAELEADEAVAASADGLPADLAAKLAAFEAHHDGGDGGTDELQHSDDDGSGSPAGSAGASGGGGIYGSMMKAGSWRLA
jgi:hypothetical protein